MKSNTNMEENEARIQKRKRENSEKSTATSSIPLVPDDVFFNIVFKNLPAKSLMRFKGVCKSWRDMISDPSSVQSRFHSHPLYLPDESHMFFFVKSYSNSTRSIIPTNLRGEFSTKIPTHTFPEYLVPCTNQIVNGLICLWDKLISQLYMLNVYTGEKMPLPSIPKTQHKNSSSWRKLFTMGFDPLTSEHKVLLFYINKKNCFRRGKILIFGSNTWRDLKFPTNWPSVVEYLPSKREMTCVDGTIYWISKNKADPKEIVECFHVGEEEFGTLKTPVNNYYDLELVQVRGNLGLWVNQSWSHHIRGTLWRLNNKSTQVWVSDDINISLPGTDFSTELCEFQVSFADTSSLPGPSEFQIVGATKSDELLFARAPTGIEPLVLVFYDLGTESFRISKVTSPGHPRTVVDLLSLVSVAADIFHAENNMPLRPPNMEENKKTPDAKEKRVSTEVDIMNEGKIKKRKVSSKQKIPDELIFEVLKRLPAKSLMRFKCVCKEWLGLICDPYFAECHHIYSKSRLNASYLLFRMEGNAMIPTNHRAIFSSQLPTHTFNNECCPFTEVVNGLICLRVKDYPFHLCMLNLTTGERRFFPETTFHSGQINKKDRLSSLHHSCMLGFDHVNKKYKVIRMVTNESSQILKCMILTFRTRIWEMIDQFKQPFESPSLHDDYRKAICANGMIYWMGKLSINGTRVIQYFDVAEEKFEVLFPPQDSGNIEKLTRIGGNLALFCKRNEEQGGFNLWRLNHQDELVWVKNQIRFPCNISTPNLQVIGSTNRDENEIVFTRNSKHDKVIIYDVTTHDIRTATVTWPGMPAMVDAFFSLISEADVSDFVENILPLRRRHTRYTCSTSRLIRFHSTAQKKGLTSG